MFNVDKPRENDGYGDHVAALVDDLRKFEELTKPGTCAVRTECLCVNEGMPRERVQSLSDPIQGKRPIPWGWVTTGEQKPLVRDSAPVL